MSVMELQILQNLRKVRNMKDNRDFDKQIDEGIHNLADIISPSMEEVAIANYLRQQWKEIGGDVQTDVMGNIYAFLEAKQKECLNLGIVAHMDTVAVQITNILPSGMLQFRHIGLMPHTLLGQPMKVLTKNGIIDGVIGFDPTSQYGQPKGLVLEDLWLDVGALNEETAVRMIEIGDMAVLAPRMVEMGDNYVCGTAIDDRIGIFIMSECLKFLSKKRPDINLYFIGSVQEEIGLRGASVIPDNIKLDACLVLDVDYATDTPASHENQMGKLSLGKGVGLHAKADNNPILRRVAVEVAEREEIPYQITLGRFTYGGTDTASMQIRHSGVATLNINIPCRYMHSPIEMCNKKDVESAIRLIISLVEELDRCQQRSFLPGID